MRIEQVDFFRVAIPIEAPILTAYGSLSAYTRVVIKLTAADGTIGWSDVSARYTPEMLTPYAAILKGMDVWDLTLIQQRIKHWNYYPWVKPEPLIGAFEIACLDIQGKGVGQPLYKLLGGKVRDEVPVACYIFYRHANAQGEGRIHTVDEVVAFAERKLAGHGFPAIKLKGGYFPPDDEVAALAALRERFGPRLALRIDPQGSWTPATAIRVGAQIDRLGLEYYEDPCWNAAAMAQVAGRVRTPLATNMHVTQFDELYPAIAMKSVGVVLADLWYWGGPRATMALDRACAAAGLDIGMHSGTEFGLGWAAMIHASAAMPHLRSPIDYMNMHLVDDIIVGGKIEPIDGVVRPPEGPGLGVEVDEAKLAKYAAFAADASSLDRFMDPARADIARPDWRPLMPAW